MLLGHLRRRHRPRQCLLPDRLRHLVILVVEKLVVYCLYHPEFLFDLYKVHRRRHRIHRGVRLLLQHRHLRKRHRRHLRLR